MAEDEGRIKLRIHQLFDQFDVLLYVIVALLLSVAALFTLYEVFHAILHYFHADHRIDGLVEIIDSIMLSLMVIEILYTVRVSLRQHSLCAEPFLIVGLIAAIRRILVISVESGHIADESPEVFNSLLTEIGVLGVLVVFFVGSILLLRRYGKEKLADVSESGHIHTPCNKRVDSIEEL